jgi:hypothetical protein
MLRGVLVSVLPLVVVLGCQSKPASNETPATASGAPIASAAPASKAAALPAVPVPPEPPPPQAAKAGEVPELEAKLAADKVYQGLWTPERANERVFLLTAISDMISAGALHKAAEDAVNAANLGETLVTINKIIWRTGKLPQGFGAKFDAYLAANKADPQLGVWAPEIKGKPLFDATALAMWLHPNEPGYVRERLRALVRGPYPYRKDAPVVRAWLMQPGEIAGRLGALGSFNQQDCEMLGHRWTEKTLPNGEKQLDCSPGEKAFVAQEDAVVGTWSQVIANPALPNSVASDSMKHVFRGNHTVSVRMEDKKTPSFKWSFEQGKHFVGYLYGEFEHRREFRLRSADEAEIVESNGKVLGTYVRDGSAIAQGKTSVALYEMKGVTDPNTLVVGRSYVLDRETPLMPDPEPADPVAALAQMKKLPKGSTFSIVSKRVVSGKPWYAVRTDLGSGWFNSIALAGQGLEAK